MRFLPLPLAPTPEIHGTMAAGPAVHRAGTITTGGLMATVARCTARLGFGPSSGSFVQCQLPARHTAMHRCEWHDPADGRHFVEWNDRLSEYLRGQQ